MRKHVSIPLILSKPDERRFPAWGASGVRKLDLLVAHRKPQNRKNGSQKAKIGPQNALRRLSEPQKQQKRPENGRFSGPQGLGRRENAVGAIPHPLRLVAVRKIRDRQPL